jgi:uncharacterized protein YjbI with pentapeptide repeats
MKAAELDGASLRYANVSRADFTGARLTGTDLSKALGLTQEQLDIACGDAAAKLLPGLKRPADWPCGNAE